MDLSLVLLLVLGSILSSSLIVNAQDPGIFQLHNHTLIYLPKVNVILRNKQESAKPSVKLSFSNIEVTSPTTEPNGNMTVDIKLGVPDNDTTPGGSADNISLSMLFLKKGGWWLLKNSTILGDVTLDKEKNNFTVPTLLRKSMELAAPLSMSFHCGRYGPQSLTVKGEEKDKKMVSNITVAVEFIDFQMQAFMKNASKFDSSYDCVGFFSIGILSGIFVTIILVLILSWAISMIMNVHTMDRFDDPKGKSIQVSATD